MHQENEAFKKLILAKGNNKSEIARKLGISATLIGQYIKGRQKPKTEFYVKWQEVYGEDIKQMFITNVPRETPSIAKNGTPNHTEPSQAQLIELLSLWTTERQEVLKGLESRLNAIEQTQAKILQKLELLTSARSESSSLSGGISEVEVVREYIGKKQQRDKKRSSK